MYKILNPDKLFWWSPLGRRVMDWGMGMAWLWGRIPFIAGNLGLALGGLLIWTVGSVDDPKTGTGGMGVVLLPLMAYGLSLFLGLAGGIAGVIGGFYAPAGEEAHPFRSAFFKRFGRRVFAMWLYLGLVCTPCFVCLERWDLTSRPIPMYFGMLYGLLIFSVWYALSVAKRGSGRISLD